MEVDRDRAEVVATVIRFWQAYERKDLAALSNMLTAADDSTFFGSDAAEVVKTRREWEELMQNDWQLFEKTKFGEPRNIAVQISADKQLASIVYEVTDISLVEGKNIESLDRFAITMRKEGGSRRTQWEQQRRRDTCPRPFGKIHRAIIGTPKTGWNTVVQRVDAAKVPLRSLGVFKAKLVII